MLLVDIPLKLDTSELPDEVHDLLDEAERRCEEFYASGLGPRYYRYVPSDPVVVYAAIRYLNETRALRGRNFCELGCGFAIASGLAALQGMSAIGLEWEEELTKRARSLMAEFNLDVTVMNQSYLPEGYESCEGIGGKDLVIPGEARARGLDRLPPEYDGLDPAEVDLFFVYPWPDEEEFMKALFREISSEGAVLLMYQGEGEISAFLHDIS